MYDITKRSSTFSQQVASTERDSATSLKSNVIRENMKPFTIILIRVLAVYLLVSSFQLGFPLYLEIENWEVTINSSNHMLAYIGYLGIPAIAGLVLWFVAPGLASHVVTEDNSFESPNEQGLVSAGSFLIGIYWAVSSIRDIASQYSYSKISVGTLIVLGISVCLMLGCRYVAGIFKKLRTYGINV